MAKYTISTFNRLKKSGDAFLLWGGSENGSSEAEQLGRAIVGVAPTPIGEVAVYDYELLVEHFMSDFAKGCAEADHGECDHESDAIEWVDFNMLGAWIGDRTPIILQRFCEQHEMQTVACPCPMSEIDHWGATREARAAERGDAARDERRAA